MLIILLKCNVQSLGPGFHVDALLTSTTYLNYVADITPPGGNGQLQDWVPVGQFTMPYHRDCSGVAGGKLQNSRCRSGFCIPQIPIPKVRYVEAPLLIRIGSDLSRPLEVSVGLGSVECEGHVNSVRSFSCSWAIPEQFLQCGGLNCPTGEATAIGNFHCHESVLWVAKWDLHPSSSMSHRCTMWLKSGEIRDQYDTVSSLSYSSGHSWTVLTMWQGSIVLIVGGQPPLGSFFGPWERCTWYVAVGWVVHVKWHPHEYQDPMFQDLSKYIASYQDDQCS